MKQIQFFVFYFIVITVYSLLNFYIFRHGFKALAGTSYRQIFLWVFIFLSSAFVVGRLLNMILPGFVTELLIKIGSFWVGPMFYFLLIVLLYDIIRLVLLIFPGLFAVFTGKEHQLIYFWVTFSVVNIISIVGYINYSYLRTRVIDITIHKPEAHFQNLKIAVASDIHLGIVTGKGRLEKVVDIINQHSPDITLFAGDMVDDEMEVVEEKDMGSPLLSLKNKNNVFAITGNHEYIGNAEEAVKYFTSKGIKYIQDTVEDISNQVCIVGRNDRDIKRFEHKGRKTTNDLIKEVDFSRFVIWLDHQPPKYEELAKYPVDLCVSGHTHDGQIWPLHYVTKAIYGLSWGLKKVSETWCYVTSGSGGWGPQMRIGNNAEVVIFNIHNK